MSIVIEVSGNPRGQPRPKAFARKFANGKVMARVYDPGTAEGWKGQIALAARDLTPFPPLTGPLMVDISFRFARPKAHYLKSGLRQDAPTFHTSKPDADNASKAVFDALTTLGMWKDDSQICSHTVTKKYSERAGATITITQLEQPKAEKKIGKQAVLVGVEDDCAPD